MKMSAAQGAGGTSLLVSCPLKGREDYSFSGLYPGTLPGSRWLWEDIASQLRAQAEVSRTKEL